MEPTDLNDKQPYLNLETHQIEWREETGTVVGSWVGWALVGAGTVFLLLLVLAFGAAFLGVDVGLEPFIKTLMRLFGQEVS